MEQQKSNIDLENLLTRENILLTYNEINERILDDIDSDTTLSDKEKIELIQRVNKYLGWIICEKYVSLIKSYQNDNQKLENFSKFVAWKTNQSFSNNAKYSTFYENYFLLDKNIQYYISQTLNLTFLVFSNQLLDLVDENAKNYSFFPKSVEIFEDWKDAIIKIDLNLFEKSAGEKILFNSELDRFFRYFVQKENLRVKSATGKEILYAINDIILETKTPTLPKIVQAAIKTLQSWKKFEYSTIIDISQIYSWNDLEMLKMIHQYLWDFLQHIFSYFLNDIKLETNISCWTYGKWLIEIGIISKILPQNSKIIS